MIIQQVMKIMSSQICLFHLSAHGNWYELLLFVTDNAKLLFETLKAKGWATVISLQ